MPWWLWLIIPYWFVTGAINTWRWWDLGSMLMFAFHFALGFAVVPMMGAILLFQKIQKLRKMQRLPVPH